jgi:citrate lyase beta subunit
MRKACFPVCVCLQRIRVGRRDIAGDEKSWLVGIISFAAGDNLARLYNMTNQFMEFMIHEKPRGDVIERKRRSFNPFSWKTILFLPQFAFQKAAQLEADCFIVDFQDAVPLSLKAAARDGLKEALASNWLGDRPIVVRINERAIAEEQELDLESVVGLNGITALMPTMTEYAYELDELHERLSAREQALGLAVGSTKLLPLIETPGAVLRCDEISRAGGGRIIGLFLGHGDLFRLSGATPHGTTTLDFPRNAVLYASRAAGIAAFDTPYTSVSDVIGLEREALEAKRHGFDGKGCIHRDQIAIVRRCMMPSATEVAWAQRVEHARIDGQLYTLARKLDENGVSDKVIRQTDGMALVDGQLVGPPHIKASQRILQLNSLKTSNMTQGRRGRVVHHRSDAEILPGAVIGNPYEMTITEGMLDLWLQSFYSHDPATTSVVYAQQVYRCGSGRMPVPFMMALYLCVSMSDTHGAIYHLGFRAAKQHRTIQTGDTLRQKITVLSVRNTSDGKRAVVTTLRELIDVVKGDVVFSTEKMELYRHQPVEFGATDGTSSFSARFDAVNERLESIILGWRSIRKLRENWEGYSFSRLQATLGEVLLHSFCRPLGVTANLALSSRFLVTHPIHLDHHRYDQGNGLGVVVSGGLVISMILSAANRDISHVLWEELIAANNVRTVSPGDTIGAFSVIIDRTAHPTDPRLEILVVKTIGVKNISPSEDLRDVLFPEPMLAPIVGGGSKFDKICTNCHIPMLEGRIVGEVVRRLVRESS